MLQAQLTRSSLALGLWESRSEDRGGGVWDTGSLGKCLHLSGSCFFLSLTEWELSPGISEAFAAWCTAALLVLPVSDSEKTCAWEDSELAQAGLTVRPAGDRMT